MGKRRLPSDGTPSKRCATLARRGDCAWTEVGLSILSIKQILAAVARLPVLSHARARPAFPDRCHHDCHRQNDSWSRALRLRIRPHRPGRAGALAVVTTDPRATDGRAIEQTSTERTDYRFPLAIYQAVSPGNVDLSVRFKSVAGKVDQAGGIAVPSPIPTTNMSCAPMRGGQRPILPRGQRRAGAA